METLGHGIPLKEPDRTSGLTEHEAGHIKWLLPQSFIIIQYFYAHLLDFFYFNSLVNLFKTRLFYFWHLQCCKKDSGNVNATQPIACGLLLALRPHRMVGPICSLGQTYIPLADKDKTTKTELPSDLHEEISAIVKTGEILYKC